MALGRADADRQEASAAPEGGSLGLALRPPERRELRGSGLDHGLLIEGVTGPAQLVARDGQQIFVPVRLGRAGGTPAAPHDGGPGGPPFSFRGRGRPDSVKIHAQQGPPLR